MGVDGIKYFQMGSTAKYTLIWGPLTWCVRIIALVTPLAFIHSFLRSLLSSLLASFLLPTFVSHSFPLCELSYFLHPPFLPSFLASLLSPYLITFFLPLLSCFFTAFLPSSTLVPSVLPSFLSFLTNRVSNSVLYCGQKELLALRSFYDFIPSLMYSGYFNRNTV